MLVGIAYKVFKIRSRRSSYHTD